MADQQPASRRPAAPAGLDSPSGTSASDLEVIRATGRSDAELADLAERLMRERQHTLFTRVSLSQAELLLDVLADAAFDATARTISWPGEPPAANAGRVVVVSATPSDLPVAREAVVTATALACATELIVDASASRLHRLLEHLEVLQAAGAVVVVAGMDAALPSLTAGLVGRPVVAVPTSAGGGAGLDGIAPLLGMLNACAPGVAVVNIDDGHAAAYLAAQIATAT